MAEKKKSKKSPVRKTGASQAKYLVIVESPAKSKTINKILGKDYNVLASMGHIIDLPVDKMGIDFDNDFKPEYRVLKGRKKYLTSLKKEAKTSTAIYLAADPDREGEAICWHLKNQLENKKIKVFRVSFEEITAKAVKAAFDHPGELDMNKIYAQQARRVLDRIVGYSLSPLLWKKITRGLSAGRVQSVAVMLIVRREEEIKKFNAQEYWSLDALLRKQKALPPEEAASNEFKARLMKHKGEKVDVKSEDEAKKMISEIEREKFIVRSIKRRDKKSYPRAPYTTSSLQQDAFNRLNFSVNKTMRIAQSLYEGVELGGEGSEGLITYMRTDSVNVSNDAIESAQKYILKTFGEKYCPKKPPQYRSKKRAQEAHEAIRPTLPLRPPEEISSYLPPDEFKLYRLIWKKFIASRMENALFSVLTVMIDAGDYVFRAGGSRVIFDGFLKVYRDTKGDENTDTNIPPLEEGEPLDLKEMFPEQHFTKPPPRYSDASLVKALEEKGIGRPSTYAPTIRTVITRNYIKRMGKTLRPTELGELVNGLLMENFPDIVDEEFTAKMEEELDNIEDGKTEWVSVLKKFYKPFEKKLEEAKEKMKSVKRQAVKTDEVCEDCGKPMVIKWGRRGRFLSCSDFPTCRNAKSITTGVKCPEENCDGELVERKSSRGMFYGCTKYPKCTHTTRKLPPQENASGEKEESVEEE
ncbi:MAG: type I DNA topoisomerase [Candidatus Omnitrophica bacterium]|nr:type I DNA topoisomerase [Candidatus Omnitrophota bacterium]